MGLSELASGVRANHAWNGNFFPFVLVFWLPACLPVLAALPAVYFFRPYRSPPPCPSGRPAENMANCRGRHRDASPGRCQPSLPSKIPSRPPVSTLGGPNRHLVFNLNRNIDVAALDVQERLDRRPSHAGRPIEMNGPAELPEGPIRRIRGRLASVAKLATLRLSYWSTNMPGGRARQPKKKNVANSRRGGGRSHGAQRFAVRPCNVVPVAASPRGNVFAPTTSARVPHPRPIPISGPVVTLL